MENEELKAEDKNFKTFVLKSQSKFPREIGWGYVTNNPQCQMLFLLEA
jgi:hypothetical protein